MYIIWVCGDIQWFSLLNNFMQNNFQNKSRSVLYGENFHSYFNKDWFNNPKMAPKWFNEISYWVRIHFGSNKKSYQIAHLNSYTKSQKCSKNVAKIQIRFLLRERTNMELCKWSGTNFGEPTSCNIHSIQQNSTKYPFSNPKVSGRFGILVWRANFDLNL